MSDGPHAPTILERLALAQAAPRCGARTRKGARCQGPAMTNGRCRMHGGLSTGPRSEEGLERCRTSNWRHGAFSGAAIAQRREAAMAIRMIRQIVGSL